MALFFLESTYLAITEAVLWDFLMLNFGKN